MRSQRTAIIVSLIIGLAIGIAILMVLWVCAVCFSKSRTKDEERQVHEEAKREQRAHQADAAVALPDVTNAPSEPGKDRFPTSHEYDGKLAKKSSTAPPVHAAATPPPVFPIDTRPAAGSPYPMVSPDPMPTRLSHHAGALPTPSPTQSRGGQHNSSPSPGKGMETNLHLSVPELVPSPLVHEVQEPRNSSPVIATVASPRVPSQKSDTEPRSHRTASARPRSKKRPSLAELDPMVPAVSHVDSQSSQAQGVLGSADAVPEDTGSAQGAAVPALDLNSITEERSKRNATQNKRSYVLEAEASGVGTTVEIDAISPVPGLPHTVSHANRGDSILEPTPQMPLDASEMMGVSGLEGGAAGLAQHGGPPEQAPGPLAAAGSGTRKLSDADVDAHVPVSVYEDAADTRGMTAIMDDQTTLMKGRGAALRGNGTLTGVQERDGSIADTGSLPVAGASESLPPGAIVRGRDEFLDQLKSKPGEVTGSIASGRVIHQDTTGIFASPWESNEQSPQAGIRGGTYVPSDMTSVMSGGSGMSTWTLSSHAQQRSVRRSAFSTMPSTSRSGRWSSRASHIAPSSSGHSNWTLSGEKSNWTVSAGDKSNFTMGGDQSNWTLSGNTAAFSTSHRVATRAIDDGRSEAFTMGFTEGASEWGLSPRGTARDDLDVGHSKRWLQNDEIVMPSRWTARADDQSPHAGLRQKYEHRKLRQQYAADDTTVPETALRRVDEWMGDMSGTRDEVVKRLLAQTNGDE